jgi:heterodisulfide reductase subunit C
MAEPIVLKDQDHRFKYEVASKPGAENLQACFSCGTCTATCPIAEIDAEFNPRKIIRMILLGMKKEVLSSPVIWRCVLCYACSFKCPQNVKFRDVMGVLRKMAVEEGYARKSMEEDIEALDDFTQKIRVEMVKALLKNRKKLEKIKQQIKGKLKIPTS